MFVRIFCSLILCFGPLTMNAAESIIDPFLKDFAETRGFTLGRPVKPRFSSDGQSVLFLRSEATNGKLALFELDLQTKQTRQILTADEILKGAEEQLSPEEKARRERQRITAGGFTDFQIDESGNLMTVLSGKIFLVNLKTKEVVQLPTGKGTLIDPKLSPDGKKLAYVLDHDLYLLDLVTKKETPITKGGTAKVTNGLAEFVAQEEMSRFSGFWWSPDGKQIAYEEADHTGVETWYVADPSRPENPPLTQLYPRPGKKNVAVRLGIISIDGGTTTWVDWDQKKYEYLGSVRWDKAGPLTILVQDRKQQHQQLLLVDPATGKTKILLEEHDAAFLNLRQDVPRWSPDATEFIWITEKQYGYQVELHKASGELSQTILKDRPGFKSLGEVDLRRKIICYTDTPDGKSPAHQAVYRYEFGTANNTPTLMTQSDGISTGVFDSKLERLIVTATNLGHFPNTSVWMGQTKIADIPSISRESSLIPNVEFLKVGEFHAAVIRPSSFDRNKSYPVIIDGYGGPHHLHVVPARKNWLIPQWLANQGFIVVASDNRGTPGRGRDWERAIYGKMGALPIDDQANALKSLGAVIPQIDLKRVGIIGWSFGGYLSAGAVLRRPDVFHAAVAGASVTDWRDYDTHYTERYMGVLPENQKEYDEASLLPLAKSLKRPLLLVHGSADDNVYFRHSLRLADALFRNGQEFEMLPLAGLTHQMPDPVVLQRYWSRVSKFFSVSLSNPQPLP
jgi:dipeptidyl-peptidase 4